MVAHDDAEQANHTARSGCICMQVVPSRRNGTECILMSIYAGLKHSENKLYSHLFSSFINIERQSLQLLDRMVEGYDYLQNFYKAFCDSSKRYVTKLSLDKIIL